MSLYWEQTHEQSIMIVVCVPYTKLSLINRIHFSGNYDENLKRFVFIVWTNFDRFVDLGTVTIPPKSVSLCEGGSDGVSEFPHVRPLQ